MKKHIGFDRGITSLLAWKDVFLRSRWLQHPSVFLDLARQTRRILQVDYTNHGTNYGGPEMPVRRGISIHRGCGSYPFGGKLVSLILNKIYSVLIA